MNKPHICLECDFIYPDAGEKPTCNHLKFTRLNLVTGQQQRLTCEQVRQAVGAQCPGYIPAEIYG